MNRGQSIYLTILLIILAQVVVGFMFFDSGIGIIFAIIDLAIILVILWSIIIIGIWITLGDD